MRESNYHSVANNRAAVTITASLYDRRALDVTSDKPLVNSLNHLTYLVSSSAKVRETLLNDGGLERLVDILHECQLSPHNVKDTILHSEKKLLTAWKWTLAFQCLVLIGTRGTEEIRQKVVRAGMLPVIATVLDNYITLHEGTFVGAAACAPRALALFCAHAHSDISHPLAPQGHINQGSSANMSQSMSDLSNNVQEAAQQAPSRLFSGSVMNSNVVGHQGSQAMPQNDPTAASDTSTNVIFSPRKIYNSSSYNQVSLEDYEALDVEQLFKLLKGSAKSFGIEAIGHHSPTASVAFDVHRRFLVMIILKKLKETKEREVTYKYDVNDCEYDMDKNLQFLSNLYLQDEKSAQVTCAIHSKIAPRTFTNTGVIIPRDDDVVWCLQLLAYISKYPYLKDVLQNTHTLISMSIRDKHLHLRSKEITRSRCRNQSWNIRRETLVPHSRIGRVFSPPNLPQLGSSYNREGFPGRYQPSPSNSPDSIDIPGEEDNLVDDKIRSCNNSEDRIFKNSLEIRDIGDLDNELHSTRSDSSGSQPSSLGDCLSASSNESYRLTQLFQAILNAESLVNEVDRELALSHLTEKLDACIEEESRALTKRIIDRRAEEKRVLTQAWDYDTYDNFDIDDVDLTTENDFDVSLMEYKKTNLFPIVEKFTFLAGTDMYYWSGVIMRNSCRRNDFKGGIRQCGNLECGKWESTPREFSKCKRCKRTKYCSRDCQMRAWHCHKNWCVPSNSSTSTNPSETVNTGLDDQHERTVNLGTIASDSETIITNSGDLSEHVSGPGQGTQYSGL